MRLIERFLYFFTSYYEKHVPLPQFNIFHDLMQISFPLIPANNVLYVVLFFFGCSTGTTLKKVIAVDVFELRPFLSQLSRPEKFK